MISIDEQAYRSDLKWIDPLVKVIIACAVMFIGMLANSYLVSAVILCTACFVTVAFGGISLNKLCRLMVLPLSFLLIGILTLLIQKADDPKNLIFPIQILNGYYGISLLQLDFTGRVFLKSLAAISCMYFIALTTPMPALFHALKRLKLPGVIIELMELMYRFLFLLYQTAHQIHTAQASRLGYQNIKTSFHSMGILCATLFARAYQKSDRAYTALLARGYEGQLNYMESDYRQNWMFSIGSILFILLLLLLIWMESRVIQ